MMYSNKLAVAIKHNGKILRENKDIVRLPFGSEFSVLVKNLNSRRVKFTLHIDGTDVLDGTEIIVDANSDIEMKRFISNGNMNEGNAFKFIERTSVIENGPRGIKVDDGIVRVEFWFEKEVQETKTIIHKHIDEYHYRYPIRKYTWEYPNDVWCGNDVYRSSSGSGGSGSAPLTNNVMRGMSSALSSTANVSSTAYCPPEEKSESFYDSKMKPQDAGITVPGQKIEQKFNAVYGFDAEAQSHVIVLRLAGKDGQKEVAAPVTVKTKQKCVTCGKTNRYHSKFCVECGTALELV